MQQFKSMEAQLITLKQLAQLTDEVNWQSVYNTIRKRAQRGKYTTYQLIKGEGYINTNDQAIPVSVRLKLQSGLLPELQKIQSANVESELSKKQLEFALAAAKLVNLFIDFANQDKFKGNKVKAEIKFAEVYNNQAFLDIYNIIGERSLQTLRGWRTKYLRANKDYRVLAPQYKIKKACSIPPQQSEVLIKLLLNPNQPLISEVIRQATNYFEAKRFPHIKSYNTYKRFLDAWIKNNYADYVFHTKGEKGLDDLVLPYLERDWNLVEVGDILILDGHVNNYEIINPITGLPKRMITVGAIDGRSQFLAGYEIAVTENVMTIASCIRRAIIMLGKFPKVVYIDNGKAFSAKYFHQSDLENLEPLFARLGIKTIFAKAYHAQSKPIEPFWDWMAELERLIPTYVGTSIEMQPPRMNRGEFIHRKLYEKAIQNTTITIFDAHRAMGWWLDQYHNRQKTSGHLKGLTPAEVFEAGRGEGVDKKELNYLMMDAQVTKLYRKGIRFAGTWYYNEALFGKQIDAGDEVYFKYDLFDRKSILVYDVEGNQICEAFDVSKVHPAAALLGSNEQTEEVKKQLTLKESLKKTVVGSYRQYVETEVFPEVKQRLQDANIIQLQEDTSMPEGNDEVKPKKKSRSLIDRWSVPADNKKQKLG